MARRDVGGWIRCSWCESDAWEGFGDEKVDRHGRCVSCILELSGSDETRLICDVHVEGNTVGPCADLILA